VIMTGCKKESFDDLSYLDTVTSADKLSALFEITQDNSGNVTITPSGEGVASFDVYYGDGTATPVKLAPGKSTQHKYAEGNYNVKIVGYNIKGQPTEATKPLTVTFRAPENLEVTANIDPNNNYKLDVSAKAQYETFFRVYFGDVSNEVPQSFNEGQTISHIYPAVGTYTLRVVALSGGVATTEFTKVINIVDPVLLPLTFESPTVDYSFINFGGGNVSVINNPQSGGINTSAKVGRMVKNPPEVWGGAVITLGEPINFSSNKIFRMKVYSPRVGARVLLKVENLTDGGTFFEKEATSTVANAWEDLAFDFSTINTANTYQKVVLIFDLGVGGDGSPNYTWLFDDIRQTNTLPGLIALPLTFESSNTTYNFTNFDGGNSTVINNPDASGINTSAKVVRMIKNGGQPWGGSLLGLSNPIDFSANKIFRMKVWSPRAGAKVLLKVENASNPGINFEKEAVTTVANGWEDLVFDYSAINASATYNNIVIIFELGTVGDGSSNFTFYYDDIRLTNTFPNDIVLPLTFESTTLTYNFTNFDGGNASVINNPDASGINTSAKVARMIKGAGQPWGGAWIGLTSPIDFSVKKTFKVKVWSPRAGAKLLLKVENQDNGGINFEKEVSTTTSNAWEELTFDFSAINTTNSYQKIVLIFDLGTVGDGSSNFTFYFDDIRLN
ncbi:MAG: hypothetical protein ACK5BV_10575, partial [Bacteroidota bacterium]